MSKKKNEKDNKKKDVKSVNKNVRSSTRKLNPILKAIVGKKVDIALRNLTFSEKRISKDIPNEHHWWDIDRIISGCKSLLMVIDSNWYY